MPRLIRLFGSAEEVEPIRAAGRKVLRDAVRGAGPRPLLLAVLAVAGVAVTVTLPAALGRAVDAAVAAGSGAGGGVGPVATGPLAVLVGLLAAAIALDALDDLVGSYLGCAMTARLRHRLFGHVLALGVDGPHRFPAGDLLSRLAVNAESPAQFVPLLLSAATTALVAVGGVAGLALLDWRLAVTFLLGVPVALWLVRLFLADAGTPFLRYQELQAGITTRLLDAFGGIRTIRASGTEDQEIARVLAPLPELHAAGRQVWRLQGRAAWRFGLLAPLVQALVLGVGGIALSAGTLTPGDLLAAAAYVMLGLGAVGLADSLVALLGCQLGAGRIGQVLDTEPGVRPPAHPLPVPEGPGALRLRGVTVRRGGRTVLDHVDLDVPGGTAMAVVGASGSGKSLLVALAGRLLDPEEGRVELDGVPVERLEPAVLRRCVTYAFERPALLGATVHDTIAYARPEATRAEVVTAATVAQADRFVRLLPAGYDTPLAQAPLSGGELQRLGLARAVLASARTVVLDDATSSLDTATEALVTEALDRVLAGRTALVVAHRAATAARADAVAWLVDGRVRAVAPHHELWTRPAYRAAFGAEEPDEEPDVEVPA